VITRKRKRKPTAADEYKAALAGLPHGEPRVLPDTFVEFAANNLVDEHERLERALKKSLAGMQRRAGKHEPGTKTQRNRAKYAPLVAECERLGVSLARPHTADRLDAVMVVAAKVDPSLTRPQVLKHLQRHPQK
jgi:hypothetical protein